uniref:RNA-directed RNA polymerase n=1 Tax=Riboviria sp. TaxID=2585031 RepID=A0A6M3YNQ7_9VIRU|nr:MAG: RNA-dependent RNA polymerase [Riboviria sp.]
MHGTPLRPMRPGARIVATPEPEHRQRTYCIYYQPNFPITRKVYLHNNCRCNELVSLRNRVLFQCITPSPRAVTRCKLVARLIADWLPQVDKQDGEWIQSYTGRKKRKYLEAESSLNCIPLRRSDSYVAAFIKAEKIFELKDPRMIQARSARYNYALGNYLKPLEHHLYNIKGTGRLRKYLPPGRLIAKGCNMQRRALLIKKKMQRFVEPVVISIDASRFDAHITTMLEVEHLIYKRYWKSPELDRLLAWQVHNRGRTSTGLRYRCQGGRMSGDMNTALGNCLISIIILANVMRELKIKPEKWDMLCDGDDVLLIMDRRIAPTDEQLINLYKDHGLPIKLENKTSEYHKVRFCQSFPVQTQMGPKMVAFPERTLSRALVGVKHWSEPKFIPKYLCLIGYCELALNMGCPVLQEFALTVLSWGTNLPKNLQATGRTIKAMREERHHPICPLPITSDARLSFELATGIGVEEQRAMEGALRALRRHGSQKETITTDTPPSKWAPRWLKPTEGNAAPDAEPPKATAPLKQLQMDRMVYSLHHPDILQNTSWDTG